jgi:hypothetical protein
MYGCLFFSFTFLVCHLQCSSLDSYSQQLLCRAASVASYRQCLPRHQGKIFPYLSFLHSLSHISNFERFITHVHGTSLMFTVHQIYHSPSRYITLYLEQFFVFKACFWMPCSAVSHAEFCRSAGEGIWRSSTLRQLFLTMRFALNVFILLLHPSAPFQIGFISLSYGTSRPLHFSPRTQILYCSGASTHHMHAFIFFHIPHFVRSSSVVSNVWVYICSMCLDEWFQQYVLPFSLVLFCFSSVY